MENPISSILRSNKTVFTFKDIALIWGGKSKANMIAAANYYVKTGQLYRIRRGIYAKDQNYSRLELATRIFTPSYVSFESVLTDAGINFQFYSQIFIAAYQTRKILIDGQAYNYRKIKDFVLTDSLGIEQKDGYSVASPERAFLDTIYIHKDYHFDNMASLNWEKVFEILPIYKNKRMAEKVKKFFKNYSAQADDASIPANPGSGGIN